MITKLILIVVAGLVLTSCGSKENRTHSEQDITGTYVLEYSFAVKNQETGEEIGMRSVRDTIFIRAKQTGYEVANNKWRLNDYDKEGWQNMEHSDDRPLSTYNAVFDVTDNSLNAQLMAPLYLILPDGILYKGKGREFPYRRI